MLGVLLGSAPSGESIALHAFSGMLAGSPHADGFVGPTRSGQLTQAQEEATLGRLSELSRAIGELDTASVDEERERALAPVDARLQELIAGRRLAQARRREERLHLGEGDPAASVRAALAAESAAERRAIRELRRQREQADTPYLQRIETMHAKRAELKRERRRLSRELQSAMHAAHGLVNFANRFALLRDLFDSTGIPSGAGECCAPKLLHAAALRGVRPLAMAEVWCGPPPADGSKRDGALYPACEEKCAPLLGHLLCGAEHPQSALPILFEDEHLIVIDKPAGLLSVPGRRSEKHDSVESRLRLLYPSDCSLRAAHRLDEATSGVLVVGRTAASARSLAASFAGGRIHKTYEAIVDGVLAEDHGVVDLRLRSDHASRPRQIVDPVAGKPARTRYEVRNRTRSTTRLGLFPETGRTHQLRLHCAAGLGAPILGDPLYGDENTADRLMLHAESIELPHPATGETMTFESKRMLPTRSRPPLRRAG